MRTPTYLSPSQIAMYEQSPEKYFLNYIVDDPPPRSPQTQPMAVGSAFDAYVKSYLHHALFGGTDPRFELTTIFEAQVEPAMREWAWDNGAYVFEQYKQSGALTDLMLMLSTGQNPRFEFEVRGAVNGYREGVTGQFEEVVLLGKPDVDFTSAGGVHVILDFKVNGYCANYNKSPAPYYLRMRSAGGTNHGMHAKCGPRHIDDVQINGAAYLDHIDKGWARQLAIYGWLCGEPIGSQFVTIIHQIVCSPTGGLPKIRVAEHHNYIGTNFQQKVFDKAVELWELVHSDHFFRFDQFGKPMSKEANDLYIEALTKPVTYESRDINSFLETI